MLKITDSTKSTANSKKTKFKIGSNSVVGDMIGGGEAINSTKRKNQAKTTKSKIMVKSKNHDFPKFKTEKARTGFFTSKAKLVFTH